MASEDRPAKRRKKSKNDPMTINVGGKLISIEGYLNPKKKDPPVTDEAGTGEGSGNADSGSAVTRTEDTETKEGKQEQHADEKPKRRHHKSEGDHRPRPHQDSRLGPLEKARRALPIWQHRDQIKAAVASGTGKGGNGNDVLLLVGETGSGKSTQVPQYLYQEPWCTRQKVKIGNNEVFVGGTIAITQPRRVAATTLAHRVAQEVGTPLGSGRNEGKVGYSVRFDHNVPRGTQIKFLTEGMLLQELLRDRDLRQYSAIVVDEIHERSLDVDLLVGFLKQILAGDKEGRGGVPLKVIIMSATADVETMKDFFADIPHAPEKEAVQVLHIKGRQFPVDIQHEMKPVPDWKDALVKKILEVHVREPFPGDILAFLVGQEEIESAQRLIEEYAETLASNVPKLKVLPLYGQLSMDGQREAFLPVKQPFTRKIVLATNIAETSVTVPGVRYVVDCGKAKLKQYRSRLGMESLLEKPISKSSAVQRTGRAGREGPGKCYRLYTEDSFKGLDETDLPEILRNDVLGAVLTMKARGIENPITFPLMSPPSLESIERALLDLNFLGALDDDGNITKAGEKMARFPVSAPLGAVLLAAAKPEFDCVLEVIDIISCITSGADIFMQVHSEEAMEEVEAVRKQLQRREGDLLTFLTTMQQYTAENSDRVKWCKDRRINIRNMKQSINIRRQLRALALKEKLIAEAAPPDPQPFTPLQPDRASALLKCFLHGFVTKTARLAGDGSYETCVGKHTVAVHPSSVLRGQKKEAIMFLEYVYTTKNYAKKVSVIQEDWIAEALRRTDSNT
ncbi:helicase associated domain (HA2) domain-containing protein [Sarocladium implicatum]|nr:helicase associated domain (HA2) domain-containing protein [Sarocladium implicatum]